ncbi:MAG: hypothetical protein A2493_03780 [Candidatus Magasanikbacteria bacterium RIFOXYC12_FULL_33_11]|uniref:Uncharacterized protein n=1 Tax=Candidatus Magasanikbacteria bacterium RIFOXYC12_FULL_33_11 TaxID=1798701 RepID=A0A1F6NMH2_9BACT|nr:MAG: hypothetical protein A2493_03780 [Candidatus Magasanikbacteria bacterium RIFOXYC12_FULL_33_11]
MSSELPRIKFKEKVNIDQIFFNLLQSKMEIEDLRAELSTRLKIDLLEKRSKEEEKRLNFLYSSLDSLAEMIVQAEAQIKAGNIDLAIRVIDQLSQRKEFLNKMAREYLGAKGKDIDTTLEKYKIKETKEKLPLPAKELDPSSYMAEDISIANDLLAFETEQIFQGDHESHLIISDLHLSLQKKSNGSEQLENWKKTQASIEIVNSFLSDTRVVADFLFLEKQKRGNSNLEIVDTGSLIWLQEKYPQVWQAIIFLVQNDNEKKWLKAVAGQPTHFVDLLDAGSISHMEVQTKQIAGNILALAIQNSRDRLGNERLNTLEKQKEKKLLLELYGSDILEEVEQERMESFVFRNMVDSVVSEIQDEQEKESVDKILSILEKNRLNDILEFSDWERALSSLARASENWSKEQKENIYLKLVGFLETVSNFYLQKKYDNPGILKKIGRAFNFFKSSEKRKKEFANQALELESILLESIIYFKKMGSSLEKEESQVVINAEKQLSLSLLGVYSLFRNEANDEYLQGRIKELKIPDFRNFDFSHLDLKGLNLSEIDFGNSDLSFANLQETSLQSANLDNIRKNSTHFENADFRGCDLRKFSFRDVQIDGANFDEGEDIVPKWLRFGLDEKGKFSREKLSNSGEMIDYVREIISKKDVKSIIDFIKQAPDYIFILDKSDLRSESLMSVLTEDSKNSYQAVLELPRDLLEENNSRLLIDLIFSTSRDTEFVKKAIKNWPKEYLTGDKKENLFVLMQTLSSDLGVFFELMKIVPPEYFAGENKEILVKIITRWSHQPQDAYRSLLGLPEKYLIGENDDILKILLKYVSNSNKKAFHVANKLFQKEWFQPTLENLTILATGIQASKENSMSALGLEGDDDGYKFTPGSGWPLEFLQGKNAPVFAILLKGAVRSSSMASKVIEIIPKEFLLNNGEPLKHLFGTIILDKKEDYSQSQLYKSLPLEYFKDVHGKNIENILKELVHLSPGKFLNIIRRLPKKFLFANPDFLDYVFENLHLPHGTRIEDISIFFRHLDDRNRMPFFNFLSKNKHKLVVDFYFLKNFPKEFWFGENKILLELLLAKGMLDRYSAEKIIDFFGFNFLMENHIDVVRDLIQVLSPGSVSIGDLSSLNYFKDLGDFPDVETFLFLINSLKLPAKKLYTVISQKNSDFFKNYVGFLKLYTSILVDDPECLVKIVGFWPSSYLVGKNKAILEIVVDKFMVNGMALEAVRDWPKKYLTGRNNDILEKLLGSVISNKDHFENFKKSLPEDRIKLIEDLQKVA